MDKIKESVSKNICEHRKRLNLTQLQLAEKLSYSDKAVSKWERGEAVPDVYILRELAHLFGITVDELIGNASPTAKANEGSTHSNKIVISLLSVGLVWLVATIAFVVLDLCEVPWRIWMAFIYALPASAIVGIVFSMLWGKRPLATILVSLLIWTVALSVFLTLPSTKLWLIFIIAVPLQALTVLWLFRKKK